MRRLIVMAQDVGLELILEYLGHVIDRGIEHGDGLAVRSEHVDDRRDQAARPSDQRRTRLDSRPSGRDASSGG